MKEWHFACTAVHALAGAAFFGSMFYSFFVVQPRARAFFSRRGDLEGFFAALAFGARYKVLLAFVLILFSGLGLLALRSAGADLFWWIVVGVKSLLFLAATLLFTYISWHLWPVRLFALPEELPHLDRVFRRVAFIMLTLIGSIFALGVLSRIMHP